MPRRGQHPKQTSSGLTWVGGSAPEELSLRKSSSLSDSLSVAGSGGGSDGVVAGSSGGAVAAGGEEPTAVASRSFDQSWMVERNGEGLPEMGLPKTRTECSAWAGLSECPVLVPSQQKGAAT